MKLNRVKEVLNNKDKVDIFYDDRPVWVQSIGSRTAKVGFIDNFAEKDVYIDDLYERNLFRRIFFTPFSEKYCQELSY